MAIYNLYLDESTTHTSGKHQFHAIAGIIVEDNYHNNTLKNEINKLKLSIWKNTNVVLHEKDIRDTSKAKTSSSPNYSFFCSFKNVKSFYVSLEKIINHSDIWIMGACINEDELNKRFHQDIQTDRTSIMLQIILENFCHFLKEHNAIGNIYYESIGEPQDRSMCMRFHHIKSIGTMYVEPYAFQKYINGIFFPKKSDNIVGLQLADFIPGNIARKTAGKTKKNNNLYKVIRKKLYAGGKTYQDKDKYGIKCLP